MKTKSRILTNNEMAKAFGGYDFRTEDMKRVCIKQDEISFKAGIKEVVEWIERTKTISLRNPESCLYVITWDEWQNRPKEWER